jgi:hypothetical protein
MRKYSFWKKVVLGSLILIVLSVEVFAGSRDHYGGFFLRLSTGFGGAQTEYSDPSFPPKFSGLSGDANIAIGASFNNFVLHATIFGFVISDPALEIGGVSGTFNGNVSVYSVGVGVTYYLMPANLYLSGSAGIGSLELDMGAGSIESDPGPAFDLTLGKEWWVGGSWGLGVAGAFGYHSIKESDSEYGWSGVNLAVRFTATLN